MIFFTPEHAENPFPEQRMVIIGGAGEIVGISEEKESLTVRITGGDEFHLLRGSLVTESTVRPRVGGWFSCTFDQVVREGGLRIENVRDLQMIHPDFLETPAEAFSDLRQHTFRDNESAE